MRDEDFYGLAACEILEKTHSVGLMAKAYAAALGDAEKTKALYIGMRAEQLKVEFIANQKLARANAKRQKIVEEEARVKREKQAKAEEVARKKQEHIARQKKEASEAQFAEHAWSGSGYQDPRPEPSILCPTLPSSSPPQPEATEREELMSIEELDQIVESLKRASEKSGFFRF